MCFFFRLSPSRRCAFKLLILLYRQLITYILVSKTTRVKTIKHKEFIYWPIETFTILVLFISMAIVYCIIGTSCILLTSRLI